MSVLSKLMGVAAGASAVTVIGLAVAQGVPPRADVSNPALGAGQQSTQGTSMGETGVLAEERMPPPMAMRAEPATVATEPPPPVAQAPEPAPPPPVAEAPAPAPEVAQAPAPAPMPEQQVAQAPAPRADRN